MVKSSAEMESKKILSGSISASNKFPNGHFYSPVPSPQDVDSYFDTKVCLTESEAYDAININLPQIIELLECLYSRISLNLPEKKDDSRLFYCDNGYFASTDAYILHGWLNFFRPTTIVEVGSGFSSAVILETVLHNTNYNPLITFIDPYPQRLLHLIGSIQQSKAAYRVYEKPLQLCDLSQFRELRENDLLFIDSSHVLKTGNDLYFLFNRIFPLLARGVVVHFHDIFDRFEYPDSWIKDGWNWNECYALKLFLAHNQDWEILMFNNLVTKRLGSRMKQDFSKLKDFGGSLYLRKNV